MMTEAEIGVMGLQANNCLQHRKLRKGLRIDSPLET